MVIFNNIFKAQTVIALIGWLVLILTPRWQFGTEMVVSMVIFMLSVLYVYLLVFGRRHDDSNIKSEGNALSLNGVISLFKSPHFVIVGWVHYLAFDLMVGLLILNDSQAHDISHWFVVPCLLATFMVGPLGLLAYLILRVILTGDASLALF